MATFSQLFENLCQQYSIPQERGAPFERTCKWYLRSDPKYRKVISHVWLFKEWPQNWGPDRGIDLVAETFDKKLWAIQAKAYEPSHTITKRDVDTFLSESARPCFDHRLVIATTDKVARSARQVMEAAEKSVGCCLLSDLERANLNWPSSPGRLRGRQKPKSRLRLHQRNAMRDAMRGLSRTDRGQLVMACGTGKTLIAVRLVDTLAAQRTLVLVPTLTLLKETLNYWTAQAEQEFRFLPVCSDETVGLRDSLTSSLVDLGLPATTDPSDIRRFLRSCTKGVVFATYQSSPQIAKALGARGVPSFDLAIADEAHRCTGNVESAFGTILDATKIRARKRLFMTATPRIVTRWVRRRAEGAGIELASMDDPKQFGPEFHHLSFAEAKRRRLLTDYRAVIVHVTDEMCQEWAEAGRLVTREDGQLTDARTLASHIALAKTMKDFNLRRVLSFHGRVKRAREFAKEFPAVLEWAEIRTSPAGTLWTQCISGDMDAGNREVHLRRFRDLRPGERGLVTNVRCLSEGINVPTLDGVVFIDPKHSQIEIVQAVGRAIRKAKDKKVGIVLIPVFVGGMDDPETALERSEFGPVWEVLKSLRSHDEQLAAELDGCRSELGRRGKCRLPKKIQIDLPAGVTRRFAEAFGPRLVEMTTPSWEFFFGLLERFVDRTGHAEVPTGHQENGFKLASWINAQRMSFKNGRLSKERIRRLEALPGWLWDTREARWETWFKKLQVFAQREGHCLVPDDHREGDFPLGSWVKHQREFYTTEQPFLTEDRIRRLSQLGFVWDARGAKWEEGFRCLQEFCDRNGHARVSKGYSTEDGFPLGAWVHGQRQRYKKLGQDRKSRLERLPGWVWNTRDAAWHKGFEALTRFAEREGHALVPAKHIEVGFKLGVWVGSQRRAGNRLSPDEVAVLNSLPGWVWDAREAQREGRFQQGLEHFLAYRNREGHALVPAKHVENGFTLGGWVDGVRQDLRRGKLSPDKIPCLKDAGFVFDALEARWNRMYDVLSAFARREGHARVTAGTSEGREPLGDWVSTQRQFRKKGKLSEERIRKLEHVSGWEW